MSPAPRKRRGVHLCLAEQRVISDEFLVKGEQIQGMLGGGQVGGTNLVVPLEISVLVSDAEAAVELLYSVAGYGEETGV